MKRKSKSANKGGRKPGWTEPKRRFVELLKEKKTQTEAARLAYPRHSRPDVQGTKLMKDPLVLAAMEEHNRLVKIAAEKAAETEGKIVGKARGLARAEHLNLLADIARDKDATPSARVAAIMGSAELNHMRISRSADLTKEFENRTEEENLFFACNGYWPEDEPVEQRESGAAGVSSPGTTPRKPN